MDITVRVRLINSKEEVLLVFEGGQRVIKGDESFFPKPFGCGLPGGRKKPDETSREAAVRELEEETGMEADIGDKPAKVVPIQNHEIWLFSARNPRGEIRINDARIHGVRWMSWKLVYGDVKFNNRRYSVYESHLPLIHFDPRNQNRPS